MTDDTLPFANASKRRASDLARDILALAPPLTPLSAGLSEATLRALPGRLALEGARSESSPSRKKNSSVGALQDMRRLTWRMMELGGSGAVAWRLGMMEAGLLGSPERPSLFSIAGELDGKASCPALGADGAEVRLWMEHGLLVWNSRQALFASARAYPGLFSGPVAARACLRTALLDIEQDWSDGAPPPWAVLDDFKLAGLFGQLSGLAAAKPRELGRWIHDLLRRDAAAESSGLASLAPGDPVYSALVDWLAERDAKRRHEEAVSKMAIYISYHDETAACLAQFLALAAIHAERAEIGMATREPERKSRPSSL